MGIGGAGLGLVKECGNHILVWRDTFLGIASHPGYHMAEKLLLLLVVRFQEYLVATAIDRDIQLFLDSFEIAVVKTA